MLTEVHLLEEWIPEQMSPGTLFVMEHTDAVDGAGRPYCAILACPACGCGSLQKSRSDEEERRPTSETTSKLQELQLHREAETVGVEVRCGAALHENTIVVDASNETGFIEGGEAMRVQYLFPTAQSQWLLPRYR